MNILQRFDVTTTLGIEESILQNWLNMIEANYHSSNSYHNSTHAADVLQASAFFLEQSRIQVQYNMVNTPPVKPERYTLNIHVFVSIKSVLQFLGEGL